MSDLACSILCPPAVEEKLLDALLLRYSNELFTSAPTFAHGVAHGAMSTSEQVLGRARNVLVQILLTRREWDELRTVLASEFAGTAIRWWVHAISEEGVCA